MTPTLDTSDRLGLLRPALDIHTLGLSSLQGLLAQCGIQAVTAPAPVCAAAQDVRCPENARLLRAWLQQERLTALGLSYRLDPDQAIGFLTGFLHHLREARLWRTDGAPLKAVYFAGLPAACAKARALPRPPEAIFEGDESPLATLERLGVPAGLIPCQLGRTITYDERRLRFGEDLIRGGRHLGEPPPAAASYPAKGSRDDNLVARLAARAQGVPLLRTHMGPWLPEREQAVRLFHSWCRQLARDGFIDILSIGTSQLSQEAFGEDWTGRPDGGGVPLANEQELHASWQAARPMLVRAYAGTRNVPHLARVLEQHLNNAWHTLSLWWFNRLDGRGPNGLADSLREHIATIRYAAAQGKPFEANVPHHFMFRGADDVTYVASAVLAARVSRACGIRHHVLQVMLNTPKTTWGVQDLARVRACLRLLAPLEGPRFRVLLQPRAGLDYFSHNEDKARAQLAACTALMDDIVPDTPHRLDIIHVVSHTEGARLADPAAIRESAQITLHALKAWRALRRTESPLDAAVGDEVERRTQRLVHDAALVLGHIDRNIPEPESAEGLFRVFQEGYFPVPRLWNERDEHPRAVSWETRWHDGGMQVVDAQGQPLPVSARLDALTLERKLPHHA